MTRPAFALPSAPSRNTLILRAVALLLPAISLSVASLRASGRAAAARPAIYRAAKPAAFPHDDLGRAVALKAPARRILCIGPGATETVFALGLGQRMVGRDSAANYPPAALKVPIAGDYRGPFYESALAARPDLIVAQGETYDASRAEQWSRMCHAPVAIVGSATVAGVARDIRKVGAWLGVPAMAARLTPPIGVSRLRPVSAFFEVDRSLWTAGRGTLIDDVMRYAALRNVAGDIRSYKQFNVETLLARNPVVYIAPGDPKQRAAIVAQLQSEPGVGALPCVRHGHVVVIDPNLLVRPGPRLWRGVRLLTVAAHRWSTP